ncbi:MAG: DNA-binding domain-containing protein [Candidatus Obscuribacterales bacterium]|nr:DNA-binding domain-containing protein [Candidatus Obscuribacterales bacterium]
MPSLREIEKTLTTLWTNGEARRWFLAGATLEQAPDSVAELSAEMLPELDKRGIELYGNLIGYGHHDVLESIYPHCAFLLAGEWQSVMEDYFLKCPPVHYNLNRICQPFSAYVTEYGGKYLKRYPFLAELADYEWIELEKMEDPREVKRVGGENISGLEQIVGCAPVINPTLILRRYEYPLLEIVEKLEEGQKLPAKIKKSATVIAVFREADSHGAEFMELGETVVKLLEKTLSEKVSYQDLLLQFLADNPQSSPETGIVEFLEIIEELQSSCLLVGSRQLD